MKITLATIALHNVAGGLERNIVRVANYLAERGHDVNLLTFDQPNEDKAFFPLHPAVTWHRTGRTTSHGRIGFFERFALLGRMRAALRGKRGQPNTLIIFQHGIILRCLLAGFGLGLRTICSERNSLTIYNHVRLTQWNINFFLMALMDSIIVQFSDYKYDYPRLMQPKIRAIGNAVDAVSAVARPDVPNADGRYTIFCQGRLCDQKNFDCLLAAFQSLAGPFPDWDIVIRGEGGYEERLHSAIQQRGLQGRVHIKPNKPDLSDDYVSAHIFCMPSKWEGFPNALAEAMAHGLPAVGFEECAGVRHLIDGNATPEEEEPHGWLAEGNGDVVMLSTALQMAMQDPDARVQKGQAARAFIATYTPERVLPQWEKLINDND